MPRWGREAFFAANFAMTRNLVDAAVAARARKIVFVSSDMVYGLPPGRPLTEADEPRPIGPYGRSKLASEEICRDARTHGVSVTVLRPRLIVGPGRLGVLKRLFDRVRFGRAVPILGDGRQRYQMVSVFDVAAAVARAVKSPGDAVYNLGSSNPPTVRDLLATLCRRADSPSAIVRLPRRAARAALWTLHAVRMSPLAPEQFRIADVDYVLDTTKARRELGWQPQWADADMLCSAYDTYVASLARRTSPESASDLQPRAAT
jgi:dTDP-glucose 4,6-dehydratase